MNNIRNGLFKSPSIFSMTGVLLILISLILWNRVVYVVPSGSTAVLWRAFGGTEVTKVYDEGVRLVLPWNRLFIYDGKLRRVDLKVEAFGNDGLRVKMDASVNYALNPSSTPLLHKEIGPDFLETLLLPELTNALNHAITTRNGQDLYTIERKIIEQEVLSDIKKRFADYEQPVSGKNRNYLSIENFVIREIDLPDVIIHAIEEKIAAKEHLAEQSYNNNAREKEALSIRKFNEVVGPGITDSLLKWQGIDATLRLALSNNAKVLVIGNQKNGMPIIFDSNESRSATPNKAP